MDYDQCVFGFEFGRARQWGYTYECARNWPEWRYSAASHASSAPSQAKVNYDGSRAHQLLFDGQESAYADYSNTGSDCYSYASDTGWLSLAGENTLNFDFTWVQDPSGSSWNTRFKGITVGSSTIEADSDSSEDGVFQVTI